MEKEMMQDYVEVTKEKAIITSRALDLIHAIEDNVEQINVGTQTGKDNYIPMVRLQYIQDELERLKTNN